ncbi:MAG: APC family permease [Spirochaetia bacterium]|nr:APC family permease [Spirochaetia bacterium]
MDREESSSRPQLNAWSATAICGNDITSSCLYVSALAIGYAGQYAWISLIIVAGVLFLFRRIYGEAVGALPLNGGAYNVLLNTTSKANASVAACLTVLSYMATAVISASAAMYYLQSLTGSFPVGLATAGVLLFFLALTILGISESSRLALAIFAIHMVTMTLLILVAIWFLSDNGLDTLKVNFHRPTEGGILSALFFGFCGAMLGISGFESSANFVEEQAPGVFPKTLRNMWLAVSILNPIICLLAISIVPIDDVKDHKESLLSHIGMISGGSWLAFIVSIDAILVLSGAVLTSFIGVSGLIRRMALDRILPQFLLADNRRGSPHRILLSFFLLCVSILFITRGDLESMAGVYTISFLAVMAYFAYGNLLLKVKRARLPRPEVASPPVVALALLCVVLALYGNILRRPDYLVVFLQYFIPFVLVLYALLNRGQIILLLLHVIKSIFEEVRKITLLSQLKVARSLRALHSQEFVFFSRLDDISILNKVMMYVTENELTNHLKIVTFLGPGEVVPRSFSRDLEVLDRAYPEIDIEFIARKGKFGPRSVDAVSREWRIPKNFMFISSPGDKFPFGLEALGGVRLIL